MFFADTLPRHTVTASWLWRLLARLLTVTHINAVVDELRPPFALETVYHLLGRLRSRLDRWRTLLFGLCEAPTASHADPFHLTVEHLCAAFPDEPCPLAAFQLHTGCSLVG